MKEFSGGRGGGEADWCGMFFSLILGTEKKTEKRKEMGHQKVIHPTLNAGAV